MAAVLDIDVSTATADQIEWDQSQGLIDLNGNAVIETSTGTMSADRIRLYLEQNYTEADGDIRLIRSSSTLTGRSAHYNWDTSTGTVNGATGYAPPFRFWSEKLQQAGPEIIFLNDGTVTTCDQDPPHYRVKASRIKLRLHRRMTLTNSRLIIDDTPSFWSPLLTRSLRPKKYVLRIYPGNNARDGYFTRTIYGYPFTPNTMTTFRWDYLQNTGDGLGFNHRYTLPNLRGEFDAYYINDQNPDLYPEGSRHSLFWNHVQNLTPRMTLNSTIKQQSDQILSNQFDDLGSASRIQDPNVGLLSEVGLTYQFERAALQAQVTRQDRFEADRSSGSYIGRLVLPRLTFSTVPLIWTYFPIYTSFSGGFTNQTRDRTNSRDILLYQKIVDGSVQLKKDISPSKTVTVTPTAGYAIAWQDHDLNSAQLNRNSSIGRVNAGFDVRQRITRQFDFTWNYHYVTRFEANKFSADTRANDHGVERHSLSLMPVLRIGWTTRMSLSTGYDLRDAPKNDPTFYRVQNARITPPSLDIQWEAKEAVNVYFRQTYGVYDAVNRKESYSPLNTSGEVQFGYPESSTYFSQGFSYVKKPSATDRSDVILNNRLKFFPSAKWYVDFYLSYRLLSRGRGTDYFKAAPIEKTLQLVRDLHCWLLRVQFSQRPGRSEVNFYIDLKTNLSARKDVFKNEGGTSPRLFNSGDLAEIFPVDKTEK